MSLFGQLGTELGAVLYTLFAALPFVAAYIGVILLCALIWRYAKQYLTPKSDFGSLKTVTFGDESAVNSNMVASVVSVVLIFVIWGAFTGSKLLPGFLHAPGAFSGEGEFTYTVTTEDGQTDDATVSVVVFPTGSDVSAPEVDPGDGFAKNDSIAIATYRSELLRVDENDEIGRDAGAVVTAINGTPVEPGSSVDVGFGTVEVSRRGTPNIVPAKGMQMESIWLPAPEEVWGRVTEIATTGFRNFTLIEHLGFSLFRVIVGFVLGALVGIPLGYAMGLSRLVSRLVRPDRGVYAPCSTARPDPIGDHLGRDWGGR